MFDYLKGKLQFKQGNKAVVECGGIGYLLNISIITSELLPSVGEEVKFFTILKPKEDEINLYGFFSLEERNAFELINSVSGIGPKTALLILSSVSVNEFAALILKGNLTSLQKMQGIGKKTAERLVFELKDKVENLITDTIDILPNKESLIVYESVQALMALGYSRQSAEKAVNEAFKEIDKNILSVENLIKKSLRFAVK